MWHIRMLTLSYSIVLFLNFSFVFVVMVVLYWKILKEIKIIKSAIGKKMLWGLEFSGIRATSQYKTKSLVPRCLLFGGSSQSLYSGQNCPSYYSEVQLY